MIQNIYIICNENIPQGTRPMALLHYAVELIEALAKEWLQRRNYTAGPSGMENDSKHLTKLAGEKERLVTVQVISGLIPNCQPPARWSADRGGVEYNEVIQVHHWALGYYLIIRRCGCVTVVGEDRAWCYLRVLVWGWLKCVWGCHQTVHSEENGSAALHLHDTCGDWVWLISFIACPVHDTLTVTQTLGNTLAEEHLDKTYTITLFTY